MVFLNLLKSLFLIPSLLESLQEQRYSPITSKTIVDEYDYIIGKKIYNYVSFYFSSTCYPFKTDSFKKIPKIVLDVSWS